MKFWNYIGEFLLFRWLLDKLRKSSAENNVHTESTGAAMHMDSGFLDGNNNDDIVTFDGAATTGGRNLIDDSDNSEDLDDLDIFMQNNNGYNSSRLHQNYGDFGSNYHNSDSHSNYHDWSSGSYDYDDFHEEQDDYDMLDDDF